MAEPWEFFTPAERRSVVETPEDLAIRGVPSAVDPWTLFNRELYSSATPRSERPLSQQQFEERYPSRLTRTGAGLRYSAQGVPIFGNFINPTRASRDFARTYPTLAGTGRFAAGTVAYIPAARGAQVGARITGNMARRLMRGPRARIRSNPGAVGDITSQGLLGAGTFLADRQTSSNPIQNLEEGILTGGIGATTGILSPFTRRIFAPSGIGQGPRIVNGRLVFSPEDDSIVSLLGRNHPRFERHVNEMTDRLADRMSRGRTVTDETIAHELARLLRTERGERLATTVGNRIGRWGAPAAGAIAGHLQAPFPVGMLVGGAIGEGVRRGARRYAGSRFGQRHLGTQLSPNSTAIIDSLLPPSILDATRREPNTLTGQ